MRIVGEGGANVVIDYGDSQWFYRCCKKFPGSLKRCNQYTLENFKFIAEQMRPLFEDLLCPMELETIPLDKLALMRKYFTKLDDDKVKVLKIRRLKAESFQEILFHDHFTTIYRSRENSILMEMKPKWLSADLEYCRNCTHNIIKGRKIDYCYNVLLNNPQHFRELIYCCNDIPEEFVEQMIRYLNEPDNILRILHDAQGRLDVRILNSLRSEADVNERLLYCMSLRDVTCFLEWCPCLPIKVSVVDVDLKLRNKWTHWVRTHRELETCLRKVRH